MSNSDLSSKQHRRRQHAADLCQPVVAKIRRDIEQGRLKSGDRLPSLRQIAAEHQISFRVARSAFEILEQQGILRCLRGNGTYVADLSLMQRTAKENRRVHLILQKNPYLSSSLVSLMVSELQERGFIAAVAVDDDKKNNASWERLEQEWLKNPPDAVILIGCSCRVEMALKRSVSPMTRIVAAFCAPRSAARTWHTVQPDYAAAFYMAASYLIEKGCQRLGIVLENVGGEPSSHCLDPKRFESDRCALEGAYDATQYRGIENGIHTFATGCLRYPDDTTDLTEQEMATVRQAMAWLQDEKRVCAILGQEPCLWYVKLAAELLKIRVPHELMIVGVGLADAAYRGEYPCVEWNWRKIAEETVKLVSASDEDIGNVTRHIIVAPKWVDVKTWATRLNP